MYIWQGNLNVFHKPLNIGRYEFFGKKPPFRLVDYITQCDFYSTWVALPFSLTSTRS
jgi:hypothetical protein